MKNYLKYLKVKNIHVLVYRITPQDIEGISFPDIGFALNSEQVNNSTRRYYIEDGTALVHNSFLYQKRHIMSVLSKTGPVIGDCVTNSDYRGKSIYPFVLNRVSKELLLSGVNEVFIIVGPDNQSSIRGIEKAGFKFFAEIKTKRFLSFYYKTIVTRAI